MALTDSEMKALRPDALAPAEIEAKAETIAIGKATMGAGKLFVLAIMAGMFIALGATLFTLVQGDAEMGFAFKRILGGACFSLGLIMVVSCGAELFTGNCLMVCGMNSGKIDFKGLIRNWVIVYLGNLVGSLIIVLLIYLSNMASMNGSAVGSAMVATAVGKVTPDALTLFVKGILCNTLVCLAVWMSFSARTLVDKVICVVMPVMAFVACGFEHSVANMFFLPMGLLSKAVGFGTSVANVDALSIMSVMYNIGIVTLGNIVGGSILVGLSYWFVYHKKSEAKGE